MKNDNTSVKEKVKAKAKATKDKLKAKLKGKKVATILAVALLALAGCLDTKNATPSRVTTAAFGNIGIRNEVKGGGTNTVITSTITIGDSAFASADSEGSTESQTATATPTMDVKPDIDVAYNDAIKNATDASKGVLEKLTDAGANTVLKMMSDKATGTVVVPTKDGGTMSVKCENGQCSDCSDGDCTP